MGKRSEKRGAGGGPGGAGALGAYALREAIDAAARHEYALALEWLASAGGAAPEARGIEAETRYRWGAVLAARGDVAGAEQQWSRIAGLRTSRVPAVLLQRRLALLRGTRAATQDIAWLRARWGATCSACEKGDLYAIAVCPHQRAPVPPALKLSSTALTPPLAGVFAAAAYRSGWDLDRNHPLSVLMRLEKSRIDDAGLRLLGALLSDYLAHRTPLPDQVDAVVPVPTSRERELRRGGSIPLGLAAAIRDHHALPLCEAILQVGQHADHREAHGEARRQGLRQAWRVRPNALLDGRAVLLVDDILTTGTTLTTAAELLLGAGVATVYGIALMHTERSGVN